MASTAKTEREYTTKKASGSKRRQRIIDDMLAGATGAVAGAPQAMGFAIIAGIPPIYGLYTAVVATIVGAFTSGSTFLTIAPTNAVALVVGSTLLRFDEATQIERMFVLTLLVGVFQLAFGLLRLGNLTRFVSNAVMTGFITGAGVLIVLGQLRHLNGYNPQSTDVLPRFWDWLMNLDQTNLKTVVMGTLTVITILLLRRTRLKNAAIFTALLVTAVLVSLLGWTSVELVGAIPSGLPSPILPDFGYAHDLLIPAMALSILALVQSAAITLAVPEPDGSIADVNRDFVGQGVANLASSAFQGMPSGGSLSRTAVNVAAGARSRLSNIFAGVLIGASLILLGSMVERVVMAALAGQLIVAASSLVKFENVRTVWRVNRSGRLSMVATFISTLVLPLEYSIYIGVVLSLVMYVRSSATNLHVVQLVPLGNNQFREAAVPGKLPSNQVTIFSVSGNLYFAAVATLKDMLPHPANSSHSVVILRIRDNQYLGTTGFEFLKRYASALEANGGKLILSGISPQIKAELDRTGGMGRLGEANVFIADDILFSSTQHALAFAERWLNDDE